MKKRTFCVMVLDEETGRGRNLSLTTTLDTQTEMKLVNAFSLTVCELLADIVRQEGPEKSKAQGAQ